MFNTTQELQLAAEELRRAGGRRLIVVTSKPHSRTRDAFDVSREIFGLLNVWAGFPVKPDPP